MIGTTWHRLGAGLGAAAAAAAGVAGVLTSAVGATELDATAVGERAVAVGDSLTLSGEGCLVNDEPGKVVFGLARSDYPGEVALSCSGKASPGGGGTRAVKGDVGKVLVTASENEPEPPPSADEVPIDEPQSSADEVPIDEPQSSEEPGDGVAPSTGESGEEAPLSDVSPSFDTPAESEAPTPLPAFPRYTG